MTDIDYITGGTGFVGTNLITKLSDEWLRVPHNEIFGYDWTDCRHFYFLSTYGNMAGQGYVDKIFEANIAQLGSVLTHLMEGEFSCEHFVYLSSSSVSLPVQTPYSRCKRAAEEIILASGVPATIIRPYSITGVGEQKEHLIPTLIRSCLQEERVLLAPSPTHDFVDVSDVTDGMIKFAQDQIKGVFEFGRGTAFTNAEVLKVVEEACERKANVVITDDAKRVYDDLEWVCRDFRAHAMGFRPKKSFQTSINEMVEAHLNDA